MSFANAEVILIPFYNWHTQFLLNLYFEEVMLLKEPCPCFQCEYEEDCIFEMTHFGCSECVDYSNCASCICGCVNEKLLNSFLT